MIEIDHAVCVGCGFCARDCPQEAIALLFGKARVNPAACNGCGQCLGACPTGAINWRSKEIRRKVPERPFVRPDWSGWNDFPGGRRVVSRRQSVRSDIHELRQQLEDLREKAEEIVKKIEAL